MLGKNGKEIAETEEFVNLNSFQKFETPGDTCEGLLMGYTWIKGAEGGTYPLYTLYSEETGITKIAGTIQMDILLHLPLGTNVRLVFVREEKKNGRALRHFNVQASAGLVKNLVKAMIEAGGIKRIVPPADEVLSETDAIPSDDPFADDAAKYEQPPHPAG